MMHPELPPGEVLPDGSRDVEGFVRKLSAWFNQTYYFYRDKTWFNTRWMGAPVYKTPTDLWVYQEILYETRPTIVIETGTADGGSALYLAQIGQLLGGLRVITIDIKNDNQAATLPQHAAITYLCGSSIFPAVTDAVRRQIHSGDRIMVILDSDHSQPHVQEELRIYAPLVTPGCYLIVEDTNINGHPVHPFHGPGPMEALDEFLPHHPEFEVDETREKFMLTFNPRGYLRRK
jgi:cephalosporin hydroxylase